MNADYEWNTEVANYRVIFLQSLGELVVGEHLLRHRVLSGDPNLNELIVTENPSVSFIDRWQKEKN